MALLGILDPVLDRTVRPIRKRLDAWVDRRQPATSSAELVQRNIYILPTGQGVGFFGLICMLWLMGTNYENNLVLGLAFFLLSVMLATILLTHRNLIGLTVEIIGAKPTMAGQPVELTLQIEDQSGRPRSAIQIAFKTGDLSQLDVEAKSSNSIQIPLPTHHRGWFDPGRLQLHSVYPLGLFRAWSKPLLESQIVVYPSPKESPVKGMAGNSEAGNRDPKGLEELSGIDQWKEGSGLQRIAWKQVAAGRGMYEKRFDEGASDPLWLDWEDHAGHTELRLSGLCWRALEHARKGDLFGLRLPSQSLEPSSGDAHLHRVLTALALFRIDDPKNAPASAAELRR